MFSGQVVTGAGEGAAFTQVPWARNQFITELGINPFPGTLNLVLEMPADIEKWTHLKRQTGCLVKAPEAPWCNARCYPVLVEGRLPGAIIFPEVPGYPETQVEIIAALSLREAFSLKNGDRLSLEICQRL